LSWYTTLLTGPVLVLVQLSNCWYCWYWFNYVVEEVEVKLRTTVSRPVRLVVRYPSGNHRQFFFHFEIVFRELQVCYFVVPSLTRGRVCNLLLLLVLVSADPLGSESRGTQDRILLSKFLTLPLHGWASPLISLYVASYDSQGYGGGILSRHHMGSVLFKVKVTLRPTVSQPGLGVRSPSGTRDQYLFFLDILFIQ
jgi:hypothetical protein